MTEKTMGDVTMSAVNMAERAFKQRDEALIRVTRFAAVVALGVQMRDCQKLYFRVRSQERLIASKLAEKAFDDAAAALVTEADLFGPQQGSKT